ncbi:glycosyltransferase family 39 protein [Sphingopyxis sp. SE2]|uniref:glycosyltransferase family 39 protein n=1 Tax=Sphingomonadales TaxID=204457 RepID=UPI001377DF35|nr:MULTISPECIES: glycosyltransferase family 39 protein [Sphingomonadaceae]MDT7527247.1 glycosyltransferase family 39 protein [Sphingopyxis sp. SE2]HTG37485.1 glycosyltransferase family 39 protein [Sphingomonas sp.]
MADRRGFAARLPRPTAAQLLCAMLAFVLLLQVELVFSKSVNWDEFFHFSQIHQHLLGRPAPWLQAPFVALFFWVPALPGDNIDHIQLIRLLILPFEIVTIAMIAGMVRRFADRETALLCGLIYATGGYVFLHAFALRADMIAAALLMTALWLILCRPLRGGNIALILLLVGLAFVSTIKAVLYAPAFLGVLLFRLERPGHRRALASAAILVLLAGLALLWLAPHLPASGPVGALRDIGDLGRASIDRMFSGGVFPQGVWLALQIVFAPLLSAAIFAAILHACWPGREPMERILFLSLLAPLATVAIYRNAFPYHFAFILPPAAVAIAPVVGWLRRRYGVVAVSFLPLAGALLLSLGQDREVLSSQRAIQTGIQTIFPVPVAYIDNSGMAGNFPRAVNHFASGWGLDNYYRAGEPIYSEALAAEPVPMLLANNVVLRSLFHDTLSGGRLLPADDEILRENYIPHWGRVFVAGKAIARGERPLAIAIAVPGRYTVEGGGIAIDGEYYPAGSVVTLARGMHSVAGSRGVDVTLRWGDHLARPAFAWPSGRSFTEY